MDRIDPNILNRLTLTPASKPVGPRAIDPTPRLRMVDRQDTVELRSAPPSAAEASGVSAGVSGRSGISGRSAQPSGASRLVAATVSMPADPAELAASTVAPSSQPASPPSVAGSRAMKLYQNPSDQNAAATRGLAGSLIDIRA